MKKFILLLYIVIFSFSSFVYFDWISSKQEDAMKKAGKENGFVMTINEDNLKIDSEKFLSVLCKNSANYNVNVFKSIYSENKTVEYVYFTHDMDLYSKQFLLLDGVFPDNKSGDFYISTSKDEGVTGNIFSYKKGTDFSIKALKSFPKYRSIAGDYTIFLKDRSKIDLFIDKLQRDLNIKIDYSHYEYNPIIDSSWLKIVPIILLYVLSLFMIIYYYFLEYKNSAIRLLNGYGPLNVWKKHFLQLSTLYFLALIISTTIVMMFITIKNALFNWYWFNTLVNYLFYQCIIGMTVCFIMSFVFIGVRNISIPASIKNKKPLKQIQIINGLMKVIFSMIILYLLLVSYSIFLDSYRYYYKNANEWTQMKSYGMMPTKAPYPYNNPNAALELFDKKYKFFKYTNDKGAILIQFSDAYRAKQNGIELKGAPVYEEKTILINNNYLKLNPIYELDGKLVNIKDDDDTLTVLVPEKYKQEENRLKRYLGKEYYFQKYKVKNNFLKDAGKELPFKEDMKINIIWVKNNQSYFTFSNDIARDTNNRFYDGIAMILTNTNGNEGAWYDTAIGSGHGYFIKLVDKKEPYNSIKEQIENLGLQKYHPELYNAYDNVESIIQRHVERAYQFSVALVVVLLAYLFISMFTTLNYLEQYKLKHTIKRIHGYSYFKRHKFYLIFTNFVWFISILTLCTLEKFDFVSLVFGLSLLENLFIYLLIKKSEQKKMVQIIKEG
ncbi:bacteriocin-associated integral membrane family protein [Bacillus sp. CDB3]|uniref:bacteriocin-associated integral membrane family protein n=1 Tax=Bacillus sp. CDB3 TaxID=360310 RepID=UPI0009D82880|nr:DUF1430 domain-containing protein [Bacillus sp. CDB3]OQR53475.1 bacteriocin-associated protein [Bacillus sp. CDB3]